MKSRYKELPELAIEAAKMPWTPSNYSLIDRVGAPGAHCLGHTNRLSHNSHLAIFDNDAARGLAEAYNRLIPTN